MNTKILQERPLSWIGRIVWLVIVGAILAIASTNSWMPYFRRAFLTDDIRYRLTITVDDNGRTIEGSGVISAIYSRPYPFGIGSPISNIKIAPNYRGEAVPVDLGEKGVIFSVLGEDIKYVIPASFGVNEGFISVDDLPKVRALRGTREVAGYLRPKLMTFGDRMRPETAEPIDPDNLAKTFGEGVTLKSVTVTIVGKETPVTQGRIDGWLPWLPYWGERGLDGNRFESARSHNPDAAKFGPGSFQVPYLYRGGKND